METDKGMSYLPSDSVAYRKIGQDYVLVDIQTNTIIRLNETGSEIWSCLDGRTIKDIATSISEVFEVNEEVALEDTAEFLDEMHQRGLVKLR